MSGNGRTMAPSGMVWALRQEEFAALLDRVSEAVAAHSTQITELLRGGQANDVLFAGTAVVDAAGAIELDWSVSMATVVAFNLDAANVTIVTGPRQTAAPSLSVGFATPGVHVIKPNTGRGFPIVGGAFTIYGTANAQIDLTVMACFQPPVPS